MPSQVLPTNVPSKRRADLLRLAARMAEEAELIGRRMAERREELGLTQREVAERMPGSTQASDISRWERGKHRPEPMPQIAEALETTIADLVSGPLAERESPENGDLMDSLKDAEGVASGSLRQVEDQISLARAEQAKALGELHDELKALRKSLAPAPRKRKETGS